MMIAAKCYELHLIKPDYMTIYAFDQFISTASEMRFLLILSHRDYEYCHKIIAAGGRSRGHEWSRRGSINTHKYSNNTLAPSVSRTVSHMTTRFVVPKMPLLRTACSSAAFVANRIEEDSSPETKEIRVTGRSTWKGTTLTTPSLYSSKAGYVDETMRLFRLGSMVVDRSSDSLTAQASLSIDSWLFSSLGVSPRPKRLGDISSASWSASFSNFLSATLNVNEDSHV